jgi:hypothetical protein
VVTREHFDTGIDLKVIDREESDDDNPEEWAHGSFRWRCLTGLLGGSEQRLWPHEHRHHEGSREHERSR